MTLRVRFVKETTNYVVYENADMDFRTREIKVRMWIPREEIVTNIPGVYPDEIAIEVRSGATAEEVERACREGRYGG